MKQIYGLYSEPFQPPNPWSPASTLKGVAGNGRAVDTGRGRTYST